MLGTQYRVSGCKMMTSQPIQNGGRPPYWKSSFGYITTSDYPINVKFCRIKQNHAITQVTWPKYQISKIQGGRPPFWKRFYRSISAGNHLISMKFGVQTQIMLPSKDGYMTKCQNSANSKWWTATILIIVFGYISMYCWINAKFCRNKHNHLLAQVTWSEYQISKIQDGGRPPFKKWV